MGITVDSSDPKRLAASFDAEAKALPDDTRKVVQRGAYNIKKDAQRRISGHPHLPHYPNAITYDSIEKPGKVEAEIGPDKSRRQGPLGNIIEYGTVRNAPLPHLGPALEAEAPRFEKALADLAEQAAQRAADR